MTDSRDERRLLDLFDRLLDVAVGAREAWIRENLSGEGELERRLRDLLAAHAEETGPLDRPPKLPPPTNGGDAGDDEASLRARLESALGDRFELESELGRGGMAIVFRARERKHDRPVVLKVLRPELTPFIGEDRFSREVRIASRMSHPNIVGLIDSGTADGLSYFVMPYVEGETLRHRLEREGHLPVAVAGTYLHNIAAGLAHAHGLGIVHRDLKPENVLCSGDHAYILDFGIARPFEDSAEDDRLTRPGLALGTPRYMAPEQRAGGPVDHRADLYAWGLLARELIGDDMPPAWAKVAARCLANDPDDRPDDASVLMRAIEEDRHVGSTLATIAGRAWPWVAAATALALLAWGAVRRSADLDRGAATAPAEAGALPLPFAVAPFRNETDDPALDMLGRLAADWIVQGLQRAEAGPVVPWAASRAAAESLRDGGDGVQDRLDGDFAESLEAGTVVTGSIYQIGDRISLAAVVTDVRARRVISAPPAITVPRDSVEGAIRELRDRILGSLAIEQDPVMTRIAGMSGTPPTLEAYRAYDRGSELFNAQDYAAAQEEYDRAFSLDTTFLVAKLASGVALWNQGGRWAEVDSALAFLEHRRDRLTQYHDLRRRSLVAQREGDGELAYRLEVRRGELGPTPLGSYAAADLANELNRPEDAIRLLRAMDPNGPGLRGWAQYWTQLAHAYHTLGRYDEELAVAREMWDRFPERRIATVLAARALAASGRRAELDSLLASLRFFPADTYWSFGAALVVAGEEARAHRGANAEAARDLRDGIAWLEEALDAMPDDRRHRYWLATAHYDLEEFQAAQVLFAELAADYPQRREYQAVSQIATAHLDGREPALRGLNRTEDPSPGNLLVDRARVEAAAGDSARALSLLTEGLRRGVTGLPWIHATSLPDLGRYARDPRFIHVLGTVVPPTPYTE